MGAKQQRWKVSPEFKDQAIKLVIDSDRPVAEVVRDIGGNRARRAIGVAQRACW